jgi:hypothetical protein
MVMSEEERKARNREYAARYRAANPEKERAKLAKWKAVNVEKARAAEARYRAKYPERRRLGDAKRYICKGTSLCPSDLPQELIDLKIKQRQMKRVMYESNEKR